LPNELRAACALVAERARHVRILEAEIPDYAASLRGDEPTAGSDPQAHLMTGSREELASFWVTLDAVNFGSGWFPTLHKRPGRSGYFTIAAGIKDRFASSGPWSPDQLAEITAREIAEMLGQDPGHELMELFARSLNDLGRRVLSEHGGTFTALVEAAAGSAVALAERLGGWECFSDTSTYGGLRVPFLKRAQIAAADLARAGVVRFGDLDRLTMFADNLVPHVLRIDGVLRFEPALSRRIERGELLQHSSPEEVEIRACALHAVELIVARRPGSCAAAIDQLLWLRGQQPRYKAALRHRSRCTAY
jgi:hypothetical protein